MNFKVYVFQNGASSRGHREGKQQAVQTRVLLQCVSVVRVRDLGLTRSHKVTERHAKAGPASLGSTWPKQREWPQADFRKLLSF